MQAYIDAIMTAAKLFPLAALIITIPYIIVQYHRYGSILLLRSVFLYSFVLYIMCTVLLTMLPIPISASDAISQQQIPQFIPFNSFRHWLAVTNFDLLNISTWKETFYSRSAFVIFANVVMMIPLGIYLRYYFECSFGKTFVITLGFSLILELIQLTGLFRLFPVPYRMFEVDDLITNTIGGIIGYWISKLLMKILPSKQELNGIAYRKGLHVSIFRSFTAALVDWLFLGGVILLVIYFNAPLRQSLLELSWKWRLTTAGMVYIGVVLLYFIIGEWLLRGRTIGKWITHLRCVDNRDGKRPKLWQYFIKYTFLYYGYTSIPLIATLLLMTIVRKYILESKIITYGFIMLSLYGVVIMIIIINVLLRYKQLPHTALSKLCVISTLKG